MFTLVSSEEERNQTEKSVVFIERMEMIQDKNIEEQIVLYINGRLSREEIDKLWAALISNDYYMNYLKTVVNLKEVIEKKNRSPFRNNY